MDVLSIVANTGDADGEYYRINVLDEIAVVGTVTRTSASETSSSELSYTINGVAYDLSLIHILIFV